MKTVQREDGMYWIEDVPDAGGNVGPYKTKADAESDRRGLQRTIDHMEDHSFFSVEPLKGK